MLDPRIHAVRVGHRSVGHIGGLNSRVEEVEGVKGEHVWDVQQAVRSAVLIPSSA